MTNSVQLFVLSNINNEDIISQRFSSNSEVGASELLENLTDNIMDILSGSNLQPHTGMLPVVKVLILLLISENRYYREIVGYHITQ